MLVLRDSGNILISVIWSKLESWNKSLGYFSCRGDVRVSEFRSSCQKSPLGLAFTVGRDREAKKMNSYETCFSQPFLLTPAWLSTTYVLILLFSFPFSVYNGLGEQLLANLLTSCLLHFKSNFRSLLKSLHSFDFFFPQAPNSQPLIFFRTFYSYTDFQLMTAC